MHKRFVTILFACALTLTLTAQTLSEQSVVSLLTCTPGRPLYLHFGHSALRIQDPAFTGADSVVAPVDWTFNYGIFSFDTEHFYVKFTRGETDYMLALQDTRYFYSSSLDDGRDVFEQRLNLTREERQQILDALIENYRPENRVYRYNFVFDNCATRPLKLIEQALPNFYVSKDTLPDTWRDQITYYAGKWTWGEFGINLIFGRLADEKMTVEESLFLPENLMNYIEQSGLVSSSQIGVFTPRDGSFCTSPYLVLIILCAIILCVTLLDIRRKKQFMAFDATLYCFYGLLGLVITFLMFFSTHPFVTENANWLLFNPLWFVPFVLCFWKGGRKIHTRIMPAICLFVVVEVIFAISSGQTFHWLLVLPLVHAARLLWLYLTFYAKKRHA